MAIEYVKKAWDIYKKNATSFIVAKLVAAVIVAMIAILGLGMMFSSANLMQMIKASAEGATPEYMQQMLEEPFLPASMFLSFGAAIIFFVIAGVAMVFLKVGIYGMATEAIRGKTKVETMFKVARQRGLTALVAAILIGIIGFFVAMLIGGLTVVLPIAGTFIGIVIMLVVAILFSLVLPAIASDKTMGALAAIEKSVKTAKKNFFELLGLLVIYIIICLALILIPLVGILAILLVVAPMLSISLVLFYKKKK